ncbi:hypothetical protein L873DRAFT_1698954, partial [Choiromyces venosus 120613-1]
CSSCGTRLLKNEKDRWCCTKRKSHLPALPSYSTNLTNLFINSTFNISANSRKLNNLFSFTLLAISVGFKNLPILSNMAITDRIYC